MPPDSINPEANPTYLRPEANPLSYGRLFDGQKAAYERLVRLLTGAVADLAGGPRKTRPTADGFDLDLARMSRVTVVSGGRGTGKTTILLSLIQDLFHFRGDAWAKLAEPPTETMPSQLSRNVINLSRRIVWLDVLDLAQQPDTANFFTGVLVRLEDAFDKILKTDRSPGRPRAFLAPGDLYESPREKLRRLQTDVAVSWDGNNLRERARSLDPTSFAEEVRRAESVRLKLNRRLDEVLESFASELPSGGQIQEDPLFVLPVDDFDLNPPRCRELLDLLRTLSVRRLFCIALGDMTVAERVCALDLAGGISKLAGAGGKGFLPVANEDIQGTVVNVAGNIIRKVLPPAQRIQLDPLPLENALEISVTPPGRTESMPTLRELLGKIPVGIAAPELVRRRYPTELTVENFLFANQAAESFYHARRFLALPVRVLVDFWQSVHAVGGNLNEFLKQLRILGRDLVWAEPGFTPDARQELLSALDAHGETDLALASGPFRLSRVTTAGQRLQADLVVGRPNSTMPERVVWNVTTEETRDWQLRDSRAEVTTTLSGSRTSTTRLLALYTDLTTLTQDRGAANPLLSPTHLGPSLSYQFGEEVIGPISWPYPPVLTFWEADRFASGWNAVLRDGNLSARPDGLPYLVLNWIGIGVAVLTGTPVRTSTLPVQPPPPRLPLEEDEVDPAREKFENWEIAVAKVWNDLASEVNSLFGECARDGILTTTGAEIRQWIEEVLGLLNSDVLGYFYPYAGVEFYKFPTLLHFAYEKDPRLVKKASNYRAAELKAALATVPAWWSIRDQTKRDHARYESNAPPRPSPVPRQPPLPPLPPPPASRKDRRKKPKKSSDGDVL